MKRILIFITLHFMFINGICFGQNDWKPAYIIKNQGDTIYGFVDNRDSKSNSKKCYFRKEEKSEIQIFTPKDLLGYRFIDGKYFISKSIDGIESDKPVFLEFILQGKVNIYHYLDDNDRYFVEKDGKIYELKNTEELKYFDGNSYLVDKKEYIGELNFLLQDANIQSDISKCEFRTKSLIKIAKEYHEKVCTDEKCVIYEKHIKLIHVDIGAYTGLFFNSINFGGDVSSDFKPGGLIGGRLEFENIFNWRENISLSLDFTFQRFTHYKLHSIEDDYNLIKYHDTEYVLLSNSNYDVRWIKSLNVNIKTTALKIPLIINYEFSRGNIRPYLGAGFLTMFILSQNKNFVYHRFYDNYNQSIPACHFGLVGRVGSKYVLKNKRIIFFELNYEYTENFNANQFLRFRNNLFSVNLGFAF